MRRPLVSSAKRSLSPAATCSIPSVAARADANSMALARHIECTGSRGACGLSRLPSIRSGRRAITPLLAADEGEEVLADHISVGTEQAVREAGVDLQRTVLEELVRKQRSVLVRNDLVIVPLHDERRYVDALQILSEVGFGERLDAVIVGFRPAHHALPPPVRNHAFQRLGARPVESVEGTGREVPIKLGAVGGETLAEAVEHLNRQAAWVARRLHHHRRYGRHQHRLGNPTLAVSRDVTGYFAAAGRVADVDGLA